MSNLPTVTHLVSGRLRIKNCLVPRSALPTKFCCKGWWWYFCSREEYLSDGVHGLNETSSAYVRHVAHGLRQHRQVRATLGGARRAA